LGEVRLTIIAEDRTGQTLAQLRGRLADVESSANRSGRAFDEVGRSLADGANQAERVMSMMTRLDLVQITLEQSTERVLAAQVRLNEAQREHGHASEEARRASYDLERAQEDLHKANLRAELSMGLVAAQSLQLTATSLPALRSGLLALAAAETAAAAGAALLNITLTAGVAAIGIVAGILAVKSALDGLDESAESAAAGLGDLKDIGADSFVDTAHKSIEALREQFDLEDQERAAKAANDQQWFAQRRAALQAEIDAEQAILERASNNRMDVLRAEREITERNLKADVDRLRDLRGIQFPDDMAESAAKNLARAGGELGQAAENVLASLARLGRIDDELAGLAVFQLTADEAKALSDSIQANESDLKRLSAVAQDANEEAGEAALKAAEATRSAWEQALDDVGGNLQNFGSGVLQQLQAAGGGLGDLARHVLVAREAEESLLRQAAATAGGLVQQGTVTRRKGETTAELVQRLKEFHGVEGDLSGIVTDSTKSINLQTGEIEQYVQAAQQAVDVWKQAQGGPPGGGVNAPRTLPGYGGTGPQAPVTVGPGGVPVPAGGLGLGGRWPWEMAGAAPAAPTADGAPVNVVSERFVIEGSSQYKEITYSNGSRTRRRVGQDMPEATGWFLPSGEQRHMESLAMTQAGVDTTAIARGVYAPTGQGFQAGGVVGAQDMLGYGSRTVIREGRGSTGLEELDRELQEALMRRPEAMVEPAVKRYFDLLQAALRGGTVHPATVHTLRGRALPFFKAATGFEGVVSQPTLFVAGEAGPERVSILPGGGMPRQLLDVVLKGAGQQSQVDREREQRLLLEGALPAPRSAPARGPRAGAPTGGREEARQVSVSIGPITQHIVIHGQADEGEVRRNMRASLQEAVEGLDLSALDTGSRRRGSMVSF
jgi:hypothetical protein